MNRRGFLTMMGAGAPGTASLSQCFGKKHSAQASTFWYNYALEMM